MDYRGIEIIPYMQWWRNSSKFIIHRGAPGLWQTAELPHFAILEDTDIIPMGLRFCIDGQEVTEDEFKIEVRKHKLEEI
jgi:hypothetical protein